MKQEIKVYALPTEKANYTAIIHRENRYMLQDKKSFKNDKKSFWTKHFNLYATTNETPKEGDWVLEFQLNFPYQIIQIVYDDINRCIENWKTGSCRKVVATDDMLAFYEKDAIHYNLIPKISPEFQQAWVREANKGTPIVDAMMEMEKYAVGNYGMSIDHEPCVDERPKLNPQGYVTILPVKEKKVEIDWEQVFDNAQSMHLQEFISYYKEQNL